jgi:hypothetical protein
MKGACTAPRAQRSVTAEDPDLKIPAIRAAVRHADRSVIPHLIDDLENDDPAVRFYAIEGLYRLTGRTLDYHYYDGEQRRAEAVQRWRQWLAENPI